MSAPRKKFVYDPFGFPRDTLIYCSICRTKLSLVFVDGRRRKACRGCGFIYYLNPVPVAGCLVINHRKQILLVKRGIEPAKGEWSLPCGFIELGETPEFAARRELLEETGVRGRIICLHGIYTEQSYRYKFLQISVYRMKPVSGRPVAGDDAEEVGYFQLDDMPRLGLATHRRVLKDYFRMSER